LHLLQQLKNGMLPVNRRATHRKKTFADNAEHIDDTENILYSGMSGSRFSKGSMVLMGPTCPMGPIYRRLRELTPNGSNQSEARFGDGFTPADGTFAGGPEAFPLPEDEAAVEAFGRGHHQLPGIMVQRPPQMLQVKGHIFFPDADGGRHFSGGKAARAQKRRDLAPYGILPGGGDGRLL
jgi:hypothetical protein